MGEERKKKEERLEKNMGEVISENKRLMEPVQKAREEVEDLRRQLCPSLMYDLPCQNFLSKNLKSNFYFLLSSFDIVYVKKHVCGAMYALCMSGGKEWQCSVSDHVQLKHYRLCIEIVIKINFIKS